ncbi:DUF1822 family protein [[Phormidium] sp. ETS-05]|uniref:DUF1822 family protein n=1 Tax=[Phormidium] sp. ETS-05 TaxID=222819 RepID=UPI0018EF353E|nr:DUF1822 family protein [[Phormidium] sp. ETS-05]
MILDLDKLIAAHPEHLWLELSPELRERTWEQLGNYANDAARWRAYVNDLCLNAFVNWLQHEPDLADALLVSPGRSALPSIWEFVTGSRVELGETRLVLIPSEIYDIEEICVPQEWVDIPSWAGDYYLGVQVQLEGDECWMRVWGVTTHSKVKQGNYDKIERTYKVEKEELAGSINALWLSREICPPPKPDVAMLPALDAAEVAGLLQELGQIRSYSPRLELPFTKWAALLHNDGDRLQLYRRRLGYWSAGAYFAPIQQGIALASAIVQDVAAELGWMLFPEDKLLPAGLGAKNVRSQSDEVIKAGGLAQNLDIAGVPYQLRLIPHGSSANGHPIWEFELRNAALNGTIPQGYKLRLLSEDLKSFPHNEAIAHHERMELSIKLELLPGEILTWEIEPEPDSFERQFIEF